MAKKINYGIRKPQEEYRLQNGRFGRQEELTDKTATIRLNIRTIEGLWKEKRYGETYDTLITRLLNHYILCHEKKK